jgi:hypothetical protein
MLFIVLGILGILAALFIAAGVIDFKARRRGVRYRGVDDTPDPKVTINRAEANMRQNIRGDFGGFGGGGF